MYIYEKIHAFILARYACRSWVCSASSLALVFWRSPTFPVPVKYRSPRSAIGEATFTREIRFAIFASTKFMWSLGEAKCRPRPSKNQTQKAGDPRLLTYIKRCVVDVLYLVFFFLFDARVARTIVREIMSFLIRNSSCPTFFY